MNHPRSYKSLYDSERPESFCARPTLPSLRSQVGQYLPESSMAPFQSDLHRSYYSQDTRGRFDMGSRRSSVSSSSLASSSGPRSAMIRTPSTDGRAYASSSSSNTQTTPLQSSTLTASASRSRQQSFSGGTNNPPVMATRSTVSVACTNCRSAHLACSDARPCRRCLQTGRAATCIDVEPKKRGRPRASELTMVGMTTSMMQELSTEPSTNLSNLEFEDLVIIMSTSLRCARLTPAVIHTLGLPMKTMLEQPFSTFIHPEEKQEYARFSLGVLAHPGVASRPVPVSASQLHQVTITELTGRLSGAAVHTHTFRLRGANNEWLRFKFEGYLGSGFGAHPSKPESLRYTYVVLKLFLIERTSGTRPEFHSPSSRIPSSYSAANLMRDGTSGIGHYGHGSHQSGSSSRSASRSRESLEHSSHRQSFNGFCESQHVNFRPPSRSGFC